MNKPTKLSQTTGRGIFPPPEQPNEQREPIDVVIPVNPALKDSWKMFTLSFYLPKALFPVGTRPLIWHVLRQISDIGRSVRKVIIIIREDRQHRYEIVRNYLDDICHIPLKSKDQAQRIEIEVESGNLPHKIHECFINGTIQGDFFLLHYEDILLRDREEQGAQGTSFLKELIKEHIRVRRDNPDVMGTLGCTKRHTIDTGVALRREEASMSYVREYDEKSRTLEEIRFKRDGDIVEASFNMGIAVIEKNLIKQIKDENAGNIFDLLPKLVQRGFKFAVHYYNGYWYHVNTIDELYAHNTEHLEYWSSLKPSF